MALNRFVQRAAAGTQLDGTADKGLFPFVGPMLVRRIDIVLGAGATNGYTVSCVTPYGEVILFTAASVATASVCIGDDMAIPVVGGDSIKVVTVNCTDEVFVGLYVEPVQG